ncbi:MAG: DUF1360 domain-containing protein [Actinomycetota bacterium]|nr:DUF1360 domain-containing protein [Actinomycetota bacterium]
MSGDERSGLERVQRLAAREKEEYEAGSDRPVGSFLGIMGVYVAGVGGLGILLRRRGHVLPERIGVADLALITVATHKLSRLLAKDPVTSPLRAPFTRFAGTSGPAELQEKVRGSGLRRAMGALVTCPFCLAVWVATGFGFSLLFAPRATRFAASILTAVAGADVLHLAYAALEQKSG